MLEQFIYSSSPLMDFLRLNKLHLTMQMHLLISWILVVLSFYLWQIVFFTFFFNGLSSSFDDEDASFDFLDNCSFGLWLVTICLFSFFFNGLCEIWWTSFLDDEYAPFDLLDACSFALWLIISSSFHSFDDICCG